MKFNLRLGCVLAVLTAGLSWLPAHAAAPKAAKAPVALPRTGPGSLSGIWVKVGDPKGTVGEAADSLYTRETVMTTADGSQVPLQPWAATIVEKRLKDAAAGHPYASTQARCLPAGVPDMMFEFGPMQFLETPGQITILRQQFTFFRIIHLGGKHPVDPDPTFLGHSIGHWEGQTLVVDTVGLTDRTAVRFIIPHSEALHIVERYTITPRGTMEIRATVEDPGAFTRPWTMTTELKRLDTELTEFFCENNRNGIDANGNETVEMPRSSR